MVAQVRPEYPSDWPAICAVAEKLGIGTAETLRKRQIASIYVWVQLAEPRRMAASGAACPAPSFLIASDRFPGQAESVAIGERV
jgi:hypothetical protein